MWGLNKAVAKELVKTLGKLSLLLTCIPFHSSKAIINQKYDIIIKLQDNNRIFTGNQCAAAATAQTFISGTTSMELPNKSSWIKA